MTIGRALVIAGLASAGCQDFIGLEIAPPPVDEQEVAALFTARGRVVEVDAPPLEDGQLMVFWPIFGDSAIRLEGFGLGFATDTEFEVTFDREPPIGAMILDPGGNPTVGVGFIFAFDPEIDLPPEGQTSETVLEMAYAMTPRHAIIFNSPADRPDLPWESDFTPGFHCAVCIEPMGGADFESWAPIDCADLELTTTLFGETEFCNFL
jgi:hypothetical protein